MSTTKQQKKQTKRERRAHKEAMREAARRAERRRNRITLAIIAAVVAVGGAIAGVTVVEERREQAAAEAEQEEMMAELEEGQQAVEDRQVACGASEPEAADEEKPTFEAPEQVIDDGVDYRAVIETSCGEVVVELYQEQAPESVNAFVFLAQEGFYDGLEVFRHDESLEILQTGAGDDQNTWDIGYSLPDELELAEEEGYPVGSLAMAKSAEPDSAGSQFFLVYGDQFDELVGDPATYTRFGDVVEGLDVLEEIAELGTINESLGLQQPTETVYLESVHVETD